MCEMASENASLFSEGVAMPLDPVRWHIKFCYMIDTTPPPGKSIMMNPLTDSLHSSHAKSMGSGIHCPHVVHIADFFPISTIPEEQ